MNIIHRGITTIVVPGNKPCRQTMEFFKSNDIPVVARNVQHDPLTLAELIYLSGRAGGFMNLIAKKSKAYPALEKMLENDEETRMSQVYAYMLENPRVLKYPMILDEKRIYIGHHEDEIRAFLPRNMKRYYFSKTLDFERTVMPA